MDQVALKYATIRNGIPEKCLCRLSKAYLDGVGL